jgi:hypothetical protein
MKDIAFTEFETLIEPIKNYDKEYDECAQGLKLICKDSYAVPSLGCYLVGSYISLVEKYLDVDEGTISWFIYDDEWGEKRSEIDDTKIFNLRDLYNFLTK